MLLLNIAFITASSLCLHSAENTIEKSWPSRSFSSARTAPIATCLLIVKTSTAKDTSQKWFQTLFTNPEVVAKLKRISCLKIQSESADISGWPEEWVKSGRRESSLFLFSGDLKYIASFATNSEREQLTPKSFLAALDALIAYETKNPPKQPKIAVPEMKREPIKQPTEVEKLLGQSNSKPIVSKKKEDVEDE